MKLAAMLLVVLAAVSPAWPAQGQAQAAAKAQPIAPGEWIDAKTGHRVIRISTAPGASSLYFHQQSFTPQGDKMVASTSEGIAAIDLKTWKMTTIVRGTGLQLLFAGRKTRTVYYIAGGTRGAARGSTTTPAQIWAADIDTGKAHRIADIPAGGIATINADETLLAGAVAERDMPLQPGTVARDPRFDQSGYAATGPDGKQLTFAEAKEVRLNDRLEARIPMEIFTIDIRTGERKIVHRATDWLNHLQFSPTDPTLLMFCHEGPWHKVDRIWTIRTDGSGLTQVHHRTMNMEIAGHEFWSPDGKTIWYDLQTPRGEVFWVAGYDLGTEKRRWYKVERNQWSVHFNISPDQTMFSGDGGDSEMVAHAPDGKWLYLFRPKSIPDVAGIHAPGSESLISPGTFDGERLVDMAKHDYRLEPNIHFTPDGKWMVFRSNMEGTSGIYAVEIARAKP
ncbi:MAG: oligogalacturonate lyase family protein [Sphingomonas bacterium]